MGSTAQFKQFGPFFRNGALVAAPHIYHYYAGTTVEKDAWLERNKINTAGQPIVGDANGIASAYFDGLYKIVVMPSDDSTTLYTWDNVDYSTSDYAVLPQTTNYTTTTADNGKLIEYTSGTATLSLLPAVTAGIGFTQPIKNSGSGVVTIDPNGAELIDGLSTLTLNAGDEIILVCDGLTWKSFARYRPAVGSYGSVGQDSKNNSGTPNTQYDLTAGQVRVWNPNDKSTITLNNPGTITNNVSTAGPTANGRDQSAAFNASTWLHFYWIWNGTTLATLSSATPPPTGPTLPSGYTHWSYAGAVYFNGSSQLMKTRIKGAWAHYEVGQAALSAGSATVETSVSVSTLVPPNALNYIVSGFHTCTTSVGGSVDKHIDLRIVSGSTLYSAEMILNAANSQQQRVPLGGWIVPNVSQAFLYINVMAVGSSPAATLLISGYQLPNGGG